jgi:amidophosphoribosyltransferase
MYSCKFLNFSQSRSELDLAARRAIKEIAGTSTPAPDVLSEYACAGSEKHACMVRKIAETLRLTSLRYQTLEDLVAAIGLPKEKLCTYCWDAAEPAAKTPVA